VTTRRVIWARPRKMSLQLCPP